MASLAGLASGMLLPGAPEVCRSHASTLKVCPIFFTATVGTGVPVDSRKAGPGMQAHFRPLFAPLLANFLLTKASPKASP